MPLLGKVVECREQRKVARAHVTSLQQRLEVNNCTAHSGSTQDAWVRGMGECV